MKTTDLELGQAHSSMRCRDPQVAGQRELETAPHRDPVQGGDDRFLARFQKIDQPMPIGEVGADIRNITGELGDICAGTEKLFAAAGEQ